MNREESYKVSGLLAIHGFPLWIFLSESYEHFNHMDAIPTYAVREIVPWQSTLGTLREQTKPCVSTVKGKSDEQSYRATSERGNPFQREIVCSNTCHSQGEHHRRGVQMWGTSLSPAHPPKVKQNKQNGYKVPEGLIYCPYSTFSSLSCPILKPSWRIINKSIGYLFSQE